MATEKIGIYRRWLEPIPKIKGKSIPKSEWPSKRKHGWEVRWFGVNGKRYSKNFKTKKLAERFTRELQEEVNKGKQDRPDKIMLDAFIIEHEKVMAGQVSYATLNDQMRALKLFENLIGCKIALASIKSRQAEAFIAARLSTGLSIATVNKDIRTLKRVFNLAITPRGYLKEGQNPFQNIKQRRMANKPIRHLSIQDYRALMNAASNIWWKTFISIAYCSGLRRSEIVNLTWQDVDFERKLVHVQPKAETKTTLAWEPKDHECRTIPMTDETTQLLANLQAIAQDGHLYVFIDSSRFRRIKQRQKNGKWNGKSNVVNNILKNFKRICKKAGIKTCSIHDLRRSAITNWAQHLPIQAVQQFAGHSDITTTRQYYLSVQPEHITLASKAINQMLDEAKL